MNLPSLLFSASFNGIIYLNVFDVELVTNGELIPSPVATISPLPVYKSLPVPAS